MDAVREFLLEREEVDVVALVQCTSPFVQPRFLAEAHNLAILGYDSVFSVAREKKLRWKEVWMRLRRTGLKIGYKLAIC